MKIVLQPDALRSVLREARSSADGKETGGILIGHEFERGTVITEAGPPGPDAVRRADFFQRDNCYSDRLLEVAFERERALWVGEWHTHLVNLDRPSSTDMKTYAAFLADETLGFDRFVAFIVTARDGSWTVPTIHAWAIEDHRRRPRLLVLV